jgi:hypothetical protein
MKQHDQSKFHRRDFLSIFGVGMGAAAAASAAPDVTGGAAAELEEPHRRSRYKETDHVKTYYEVNRS